MKKNRLTLVLACFIALSSFAFSQNYDNSDSDMIVSEQEEEEQELEEENDVANEVQTSVAKALKAIYGNVIEKINGEEVNITLSVSLKEIETMLNTSLIDGWYPCSLSICSINGNNSIVYLTLTKTQNDSPRRFRVLGKLAAPGALPWKKSVLDNKDAYVTSIETNFGEDFIIKGETIKSGLIFTNLTPRITKIGADKENLDSERFASKKNFDRTKLFTRETYYDNDTGINGQPFFERGTYKEDPKIGKYMVFTLRCKW